MGVLFSTGGDHSLGGPEREEPHALERGRSSAELEQGGSDQGQGNRSQARRIHPFLQEHDADDDGDVMHVEALGRAHVQRREGARGD